MGDVRFNQSLRYSEKIKRIKTNLDRVFVELQKSYQLVDVLMNCRGEVSEMIRSSDKPLNLEFDAIKLADDSQKLWISAGSVVSVLNRMVEDLNK